jgi:hypothetical protein
MTYKWIAMTKVKHDDLESVLKDVQASEYEVVALPPAGYSSAGEPLITLVAKKKVRRKEDRKEARRDKRSRG